MLVTRAASGIGRAVAEASAGEGAELCLTDVAAAVLAGTERLITVAALGRADVR